MQQSDINQSIETAEVIAKPGLKTTTLSNLMDTEFDPIKYVIPELLPAGLTLLVGASKIGKSWLALDLCKAVALGDATINQKPVKRGKALYLALEDGERRLKDRFLKIKGDLIRSDNLHFVTQIKRADKGGLDELRQWLDDNPDCCLIVIDTLQKFRPVATNNVETYSSDYKALEPLQQLAISRNIAIVLIHHTRKAEASDCFDKVSGTTALMGASDCTWLIERARGENQGKLNITGRDIQEHELALKFDPEYCTWRVLGDYKAFACSREEEETLDCLYQFSESVNYKELAEELGITQEAMKMRLRRLYKANKVLNPERGKYLHPAKVTSVPKSNNTSVTLQNNPESDSCTESNTVTPPVSNYSETDGYSVTNGLSPRSISTQGGNNGSVTSCNLVTHPESSELWEADELDFALN